MKKVLGLLFGVIILGLWLTACSSGPPLLAESDEPTLVYVYTDG